MKNKHKLGIAAVRCQTPHLTEAHKHLFTTMQNECELVLILLGQASATFTNTNPLPFMSRRMMITKDYPRFDIFEFPDMKYDDVWYQNLDHVIKDYCSMFTIKLDNIQLYGGRDSFLDKYTGDFKHLTTVIPEIHYVSATSIREQVGKTLSHNADFRRGIIYATQNRFPIVYPTVDAIIFDKTENYILLGRKKNWNQWCFIGGFVDKSDKSYQFACLRELGEEVPILNDIKYINKIIPFGSWQIDDWRYKNTTDSIMTSVYYIHTKLDHTIPVEAGDDIEELKWFTIKEAIENLASEHLRILLTLKER